MTYSVEITSYRGSRSTFKSVRFSGLIIASVLTLAIAGCQSTSTSDMTGIDKAQGSAENISSLNDVIRNNPKDPEAYNVRGSAFGRAGRNNDAIKDFNT